MPETPMKTTTNGVEEAHAFPSSLNPLKLDHHHHNHHQYHFHFPPATVHGLAQKWKVKHPWHKKQENLELSLCCPETDIRETNLAYHIEIDLAGVKDKESLVIQWMSPRTLLVEGNISRPHIGHGMPAEGERQWEGENDGWATEARNPPKVT
jgi:hypothetical protein